VDVNIIDLLKVHDGGILEGEDSIIKPTKYCLKREKERGGLREHKEG
jgi:hypothetical protein